MICPGRSHFPCSHCWDGAQSPVISMLLDVLAWLVVPVAGCNSPGLCCLLPQLISSHMSKCPLVPVECWSGKLESLLDRRPNVDVVCQ
jgi:hypothetical protein